MSSLEELLRQKAELEDQIEKTRREQKAEAVATVLGIVRLHNLTLEDCGFRCPQIEAMDQGEHQLKVKTPPPAKYIFRTGETGSGRGRPPKWVKKILADGGNLDDYLVEKVAAQAELTQGELV